MWTTTAGKLFRSAPEHVRLALPAEGTPRGPELPDDVTMLQNQVNQMNQQSVRADSPNLIDNPSNLEEPIVQNNNAEMMPERNTNDDEETQSLRTAPQPDQETETNSRESNVSSEEPSGEEEAFLICTEDTVACPVMQYRTLHGNVTSTSQFPTHIQHQLYPR